MAEGDTCKHNKSNMCSEITGFSCAIFLDAIYPKFCPFYQIKMDTDPD